MARENAMKDVFPLRRVDTGLRHNLFIDSWWFGLYRYLGLREGRPVVGSHFLSLVAFLPSTAGISYLVYHGEVPGLFGLQQIVGIPAWAAFAVVASLLHPFPVHDGAGFRCRRLSLGALVPTP